MMVELLSKVRTKLSYNSMASTGICITAMGECKQCSQGMTSARVVTTILRLRWPRHAYIVVTTLALVMLALVMLALVMLDYLCFSTNARTSAALTCTSGER